MCWNEGGEKDQLASRMFHPQGNPSLCGGWDIDTAWKNVGEELRVPPGVELPPPRGKQ